MSEARAKIIEHDKSDDLAFPSGWIETTLDQIGVWSGGGTPSKRDDAFWTGGMIPWVSPKDMKSFAISDSQDRITHQAVEKSAAKLIPAGAVLFVTRSGILQHTFPVGVTTIEVTVNQDLKAIIPSGGIDPKYLAYFLISNNNKILQDCSKDGTTVQSIDTDALKSFRFPLAPLAEQKRIVSKIDELFSEIEAGERALKRARAALARYRKSVLKAAVTGDLTADWRAANKDRLEPADKLLTRILAARREAWEKAERAKLKAQGKAPKGEEWKKRYKEPAAPTPPDGFNIPESWTWAGFGQVGEFGRGKSKHRPRNDPKLFGGNYPFLQTGVVRQSNGRVRKYDQTYNDVGLAQSKLWPAGTICITIAANIAASGILEIDACFPDSVVGLVPEKETQGRYIEMFVRTAKAELDRFAPATAQKNINLEILSDVAIPFPPAEEQIEIVSRADEIFSKADHVEAALNEQERAARALKQSILKAAFEGRLVPQDPADEPAAKLLERIKMGRK